MNGFPAQFRLNSENTKTNQLKFEKSACFKKRKRHISAELLANLQQTKQGDYCVF